MTFPDWREPVRLLEEATGPATEDQLHLADLVGLRHRKEPRGVMSALLQARLEPLIWQRDVPAATERQLTFLTTLGHRRALKTLSRPVASAWIEHHLALRTIAALRRLRLARGDEVIHISTFTDPASGQVHTVRTPVTVSSIGSAGLVYFKGGNGKAGWPVNLTRVPAPPDQPEPEDAR